MRSASRRVMAGTAAVGLLIAAAVWQREAVGQPPAAVPAAPPGAEPKAKAKPSSLEAMTFPSDRNARQMIQAVKDYLEEHKDKPNAPWDKICFAAQQVLDEKSDSFFEVVRKDDDTGKVQRVSAKAEANRLIGGFPPAGRQFYQLTYGPPAEAQLAAAKQNGYDRLALADVSQRYFHTKAGAQATLLLAGLHLDRGNYVEAAYSFERLLARPESDDLWTPRTLFKALVAFRRAGGQPPEAVKALADQLAKKFPRDGLVIGRQRYDLDALKEELDRPFETLFGKVGEAYVAMRYGNVSHTAVADGGRPFLDPVVQLSTVHLPPVPRAPGDDAPDAGSFDGDGSQKVQQNLDQVLRGVNPAKGEVALPGSFPVTAPGRIVFRTYFGLMAVATVNGRVVTDPKTGQPGEDHYWIQPTSGNLARLFFEEADKVDPWWAFYRDQVNLRSLLYDNPLLGSLSHDGRHVFMVDDAAVPQPPVIQNNEFGIVPPGGPLPPANGKVFDAGNWLVAVDLVEGKRVWELGIDCTDGTEPPLTEEDEDRQTNPLVLMQKSFFLGPPLPLNGKLYVLFEKNGRIRLACLDPSRMRTHKVRRHRDGAPYEQDVQAPELVWTQRLGEPNVRLPADAYRRFQCSHLAYADGVMVCPTNAGAVVAVDVMSRSLLWARSYRAVKQPNQGEGQPVPGIGRIRGGLGGVNPANQGGSPLPQDRWRAAAPVVSNGRVVFAAFDSESVDCLDLRTGDLLWTEPRRAGDLYVGGLVGDKVLVVGKESVRAINLVGKPRERAGTSGKEEPVAAWPDLRIGTPAGHGTASKGGVYYLPLANTPDGSQPEVWAIDVEKGQVVAKTAYRKREGSTSKATLGNLVFHEGQLFAQSPGELTGFPLIDRKKREMDERLLANPKDPVGLLARGELNLDDGKLLDAVKDLKEADRNNPPEDLRPRLRDKLYQAYTELLRKDFPAGEPFLAEYKALCEVPADTDDPNARQRLVDEQFRRRTLFLVLLAKGREKQGRLAEAFDHYREFAGLGDNKQLVTIYDEPIGQTRPDVWARGRIEAMLRATTDPAARKPLDERVAAAWAEVKGGGDLDRLREFVRVFGPHFAAGREGTLLLAERLAGTGSDDDAREAQAYLLRLWATADDRGVTARAIDGLARLMTRRGLMDDAVGLYARLGSEFADVPVRDGKTGADVFNDTLTDKRLLPYLEPSRLPAAGRVKATETRSGGGPGVAAGTSFEPDGADASPVFRRYRLTLAGEAGNNSFSLKVTDRLSGQPVWTHGNLKAFPPTQFGAPLQYRLAQAHGHLMLLHLGNTVYCLDLAERRELWQVNVLGDAPRVDPNAAQLAEVNQDGEAVVTLSADGSRLRLGRSALLTAGTACLVTRDGLVAYDPLTGVPRWKRTNVSASSLVFGDDRHVFVVETTADNKARSRVFRTADGAAVDGVPDFGQLVAGPGRLRIAGRFVLATDGDRGRPRVLRLYDPLAGKDVWRKEYPAGSHVLRTSGGELTGAVTPAGAVEVLDVRTGGRVAAAALDPKYAAAHLAGLVRPVLLADPERLFVVLNRSDPAPPPRNAYGAQPAIRTDPVSGPVYCFDRRTGERRWFADKLFENQTLYVERFAELPALVSVTAVSEDGSPYPFYRVIVADKANGKVRFLKTASQQQFYFYALDANPRAGTAKLVGNAVSIEVTPDDPPRTADAR